MDHCSGRIATAILAPADSSVPETGDALLPLIGSILSVRSLLFFTNGEPRDRSGTASGTVFEIVPTADAFPWDVFDVSPYLEQYTGRFRMGHAAMIGRLDNSVVFHAWIAARTLWVAEIDFIWRLADSDRCIYDVVTIPEYRGRGIYPDALRWYVSGIRARRQESRAWIFCERRNRSSERGIRKAGFEFRGAVSALFLLRHALLRKGRVEGVNV
jgi:hypothetical protein